MMTFCTLFNVNYLDKGLVLYNSLERSCPNFILYILAMDDKCYDVLKTLNYKNLVPIRMVDFEDEELLRVKPLRSMGEYCWTCSSSLIRYVLSTFHTDYCTYIDADLYFYSDPSVIVKEMQEKNASVQVIGHRFHKSLEIAQCNLVGKYCVEFNTFKNDADGLRLLEIWRNQCLKHCSIDGDGIYWGDQKYQDNWCSDYPFCIETQQAGAGVAPWNVSQYSWQDRDNTSIILEYEGKKYPLIFYHFENIQYVKARSIRTGIVFQKDADRKLVKKLYVNYLQEIEKCKQLLKSTFDVDITIKTHPAVVQGNLSVLQKIKSTIKDKLFIINF